MESMDMGNVSYLTLSFYGAFTILVASKVVSHSPKFAVAAGTDEAHT